MRYRRRMPPDAHTRQLSYLEPSSWRFPPPVGLERFVQAQHPVYTDVVSELRRGYKETHWMWFVFPQLRGIGTSSMSIAYGIASLDEAKDYLAHPILGPRLTECVQLVLNTKTWNVAFVLGAIDARKFHSCLTLFVWATPGLSIFSQALSYFFDGCADQSTIDFLLPDAQAPNM